MGEQQVLVTCCSQSAVQMREPPDDSIAGVRLERDPVAVDRQRVIPEDRRVVERIGGEVLGRAIDGDRSRGEADGEDNSGVGANGGRDGAVTLRSSSPTRPHQEIRGD